MHDPQIVVDPDPEGVGEGREQVRVLGGRDVDQLTAAIERAEDRGELDDLGSSSEDAEHPLHGVRA